MNNKWINAIVGGFVIISLLWIGVDFGKPALVDDWFCFLVIEAGFQMVFSNLKQQK